MLTNSCSLVPIHILLSNRVVSHVIKKKKTKKKNKQNKPKQQQQQNNL